MPELPEVETVRQGLDAHVSGRLITGVRVLHPRPLRRHLAGPDDFTARLVGRRMLPPQRRGKFLWVPIEGGDALVAHLGMSGQFRIKAPTDPIEPHARVLIDTRSDGEDGDEQQVRFVDQRMFGGVWLSPDAVDQPDGVPAELAHIGRDLFDPQFDTEAEIGRAHV